MKFCLSIYPPRRQKPFMITVRQAAIGIVLLTWVASINSSAVDFVFEDMPEILFKRPMSPLFSPWGDMPKGPKPPVRTPPDPNTPVSLTNKLARERNREAADRTPLAWIRASHTMISLGFSIERLGQATLSMDSNLSRLSTLKTQLPGATLAAMLGK